MRAVEMGSNPRRNPEWKPPECLLLLSGQCVIKIGQYMFDLRYLKRNPPDIKEVCRIFFHFSLSIPQKPKKEV